MNSLFPKTIWHAGKELTLQRIADETKEPNWDDTPGVWTHKGHRYHGLYA